MLIAERSSHNREVVIAAGEDAIAALNTTASDDGQARPDPPTVPDS